MAMNDGRHSNDEPVPNAPGESGTSGTDTHTTPANNASGVSESPPVAVPEDTAEHPAVAISPNANAPFNPEATTVLGRPKDPEGPNGHRDQTTNLGRAHSFGVADTVHPDQALSPSDTDDLIEALIEDGILPPEDAPADSSRAEPPTETSGPPEPDDDGTATAGASVADLAAATSAFPMETPPAPPPPSEPSGEGDPDVAEASAPDLAETVIIENEPLAGAATRLDEFPPPTGPPNSLGEAPAPPPSTEPAVPEVAVPPASPPSEPVALPLPDGANPGDESRGLPMGAKVVLIAAAVYVLIGLVGTIDYALAGETAFRNTVVGAIDVTGLDAEQIAAEVDQQTNELALRSLELSVADQRVTTDPVSVGARLDTDLLTTNALDARRNHNILVRPLVWLNTFLTNEVIEPSYIVDPEITAAATEELFSDVLTGTVSPDFALDEGVLVLEPGVIGSQLDPSELASVLPETLLGEGPYEISLTEVNPPLVFSNEAVSALADDANEATEVTLRVTVLDDQIDLSPAEIRQWVRLNADGGSESELDWRIDAEIAQADLADRFPGLGSEDQQAKFTVVDGAPIIVPASETVVCCTEDSAQMIYNALTAAPPVEEPRSDESSDESEGNQSDETEEAAEPGLPLKLVTLEPEVVGADEGVAELEQLGIIEEIASETTNHPCCQPRVTNIQNFADLVRGAVIRPGEDFSLNGYVGRRTIEKGFVADGAIANGVLVPQVGGGVSQFATTFFNAAFFGGLDFNEYQSHSLYISRYPKGREATISFPRPDLSVKNTTPYGILVWPTYTDTSITVTFYSTKYVDVEAEEIVLSYRNKCQVWTTPRIRTYLDDGRVVEDSVFALYRPGEGFDCDGNSTRPPTPTTTPSLPGPETTPVSPPPPTVPTPSTTPTTPTTSESAGEAVPLVGPDAPLAE